jgi:hypothetical protein
MLRCPKANMATAAFPAFSGKASIAAEIPKAKKTGAKAKPWVSQAKAALLITEEKKGTFRPRRTANMENE